MRPLRPYLELYSRGIWPRNYLCILYLVFQVLRIHSQFLVSILIDLIYALLGIVGMLVNIWWLLDFINNLGMP